LQRQWRGPLRFQFLPAGVVAVDMVAVDTLTVDTLTVDTLTVALVAVDLLAVALVAGATPEVLKRCLGRCYSP
jgi:hypothetical protein